MTLFRNGHLYPTAIALAPPSGQRVPFVEVEMAGVPGLLRPVVGKLDTGAFMTILTFSTAKALGIADPKLNCLRQDTAQVANGGSLPYYVHAVSITVPNPAGADLGFALEAGFAEHVTLNLFGMDWIQHLCAAVDMRQVHLLRD